VILWELRLRASPSANVANINLDSRCFRQREDTYTTFARLAGAPVPQDRPIDGVDQRDFLLGKKETSNREGILVFNCGPPSGREVAQLATALLRRATRLAHASAQTRHAEALQPHPRSEGGARTDEGGVSFWLPGQFASLAAAPAEPGWSCRWFTTTLPRTRVRARISRLAAGSRRAWMPVLTCCSPCLAAPIMHGPKDPHGQKKEQANR
jgi:hypothetical protein